MCFNASQDVASVAMEGSTKVWLNCKEGTRLNTSVVPAHSPTVSKLLAPEAVDPRPIHGNKNTTSPHAVPSHEECSQAFSTCWRPSVCLVL